MSEVPEDVKYTKEHEWIRVDGDEIIVCITDYAQNALTDIVYIELPESGDSFGTDEEFSVVESVKSASPIFTPVAGIISAINEELEDTPELMNTDPYGAGWIVKMRTADPSELEGLLSASAYKSEIGE